MPTNAYHFIEHWSIPDIPPEEVWPIIADAQLLPHWWTGVYLESQRLGPAKTGIGARYRVKARGFLPYKLDFMIETRALERNRLVEVKTYGDFSGVWRATFSAEAGGTRVDLDWQVTVEKPLIRWLSPLLKPLFAWNHTWTTPRGEAGLRAYLARQRYLKTLAAQVQ